MRVEFKSGEHTLAGLLDLPREGVAKAFAIFAACFTCNKNIKTAAYLGRALAGHGIATLRFDFTGHGESTGAFVETTLSSNIADVVAAGHFLAEKHRAPALLLGHSFGGPAVIRAAAKIPSCRAVATINSPADPRHVTTYFTDKLPQIEKEGQAEIDIVGRPFPISRRFVQDLANQNHPGAVAGLGKPLLICHAPGDEIVPIAQGHELFEAAAQPKSFLCLDGADHYLFKKEDAEYAAGVIAAWSARFIG